MPKIISFDKFFALKAAGLSEEEAKAMHHTPQMHSASENFVQVIAHRAARGSKQGW